MGEPARRMRQASGPESGVFQRTARPRLRVEAAPRPVVTTPPHDERWALFVGLLAIAAFAVAGLARLSVGLSTAVYLVIVLASLTSFALAVAHIRTTSS